MKLNIKALSLSFSILGFCLSFVIGIWFSATGYGKLVLDLLSSFYANIVQFRFNPLLSFGTNLSSNFLSIFLLSLFTFIDGIIIGIIFGSLYNLFIPKTKK